MEHLLTHKRTPFSSSVLIVGTPAFGAPVERLLRLAGYRCECRAAGDRVSVEEWDVVVLVEHRNPVELVGSDQAVMPASAFRPHQLVIHVSGHVDFADLPCAHVPANPAPFGYMSYTADFADPKAVVDLHAAGLRVAQGLLAANERGLTGEARKTFVEASAPAQAFEDSRYW